jgi:predicted DNA-binding transcriptional regulator AlpA
MSSRRGRDRIAELCAELGITPEARAARRAGLGRPDEWLTVEQVCGELKITRRTFDRWRATGTGPRCERIGGHGPLRSRRSWVEEWVTGGQRGIA